MTTRLRQARRRPWLRRVLPWGCAAAVIVGGLYVQLPYFVAVPGVTRLTSDLVHVPGGSARSDGRLLLVTVGAQPTNVWLYMYGFVNPLAELRTREQMLGPGRTYEQYNEENEALMTDSQESARLAAWRFVGDQAALPATDDVEIAVSNISGPSAGLVFTLELIQQLLGEDLTRGHIVAATGTVTPDGDVGPVGGVRHKVIAAERAGADVFVVPDSNAAVAQAAARHIRVIPVRTVSEAVAALRSLPGRDPGS